MIVAFDTSLLVAAAMLRHPHHARASIWFEAAQRGDITGTACSHALAEFYSVLTKYPVGPRVSPKDAQTIVTTYSRPLRIVPVTAEITRSAIARCAGLGLGSGAIFDATHLLAAEGSGVEVVLTFNLKDFQRLSISANPRIIEPPDPPSLQV